MAAAGYDQERSPLVKLPYSLYVDGDDYLRISVLGAFTPVAVTVSGRLMKPDGDHSTFSFAVSSPGSRVAPATSIVPIGCGWIENVTAIASGGSGLPGTYVTVDLVRGQAGAGGVVGTLLAGYVSSLVRLAFPGSIVRSPLEGPGVIRSITGTNPAAGAQISETVPTGARWRLLSLLATLVTDANAATREPALTFDDGTNVYARYPATQTQAASLTRRFQWGDATPLAALQQDATIIAEIPTLQLLGGHRIGTLITNSQAGDDWAAPQYLVEEWLEGA